MPTRENVKATVAILAEDDLMPHDLLIGWDILEAQQHWLLLTESKPVDSSSGYSDDDRSRLRAVPFLIRRVIPHQHQDVMDVIYPVELPTEEEVMTSLRELMNDTDLDIRQKAWLLELALEYKDVFCYKLPEPGSVKLPSHKIVLTDYTPICVKPHMVSTKVQETINAAMDDMLLMGVIRKSVSE
ncbi:hypothetical protein QOT17_012559 [Balamuthia mandrillaris]